MAVLLALAVALDLKLGDPEYRYHPVRLIGRSIERVEHALRKMGADGYGGGVTALLPRLVGLAKARELVFLGERIDGAEAVRIGLASRVLPDAGFIDAARDFARRVAAKAPLSMQLAKEQLNFAAERTLDAVLAAELEGMTFVATTRDWQEGIDAFAERRTPVFKGE